MPMNLCANCSRPMGTETVVGQSFERCPVCGGAWMDTGTFERLLQARPARSHSRQSYPAGLGELTEPRRLRSLVKIAAAGILVLAVAAGLAGYYVVWPLVSKNFSSERLAAIGKNAVKEQAKSLGVPTDLGTWAREAAKKKITETAREAGLPVNETQGDLKQSESQAEKPEK